MELSYWEYKTWLDQVDFTVIGSGITGLNCALQLREFYPDARILILEKGMLPQGASTKNAGFACFGSISEILEDLEQHSEEEVLSLVRKRYQGIHALRQLLGDEQIGFQLRGGHELFLLNDLDLFESCRKRIPELNELLEPVFGGAPFAETPNNFHFRKIRESYITHRFEGQLDTGAMMDGLLQKALNAGIRILNGVRVEEFSDGNSWVSVKTDRFEMRTSHLFIATNGFASQLLDEAVRPARSQVLVTAPIPDLEIDGTFHLDRGYSYFRNIDNRILLGGGRNLDIQGEETMDFALTDQIQAHLEKLLEEVILPGKAFQITQRWSGIMGVGKKKAPIVKPLSDRVYCGARLGGMGVAIGTQVGRELAALSMP